MKDQKSGNSILSVIVVSDYARGEDKSWNDLRKALQGWHEQDYKGPVDFVLAESSRWKGQVPDELLRSYPYWRMMYFDADSSYELKNRAVEAVDSEVVAIVDADCIPNKSWLRLMMTAMNERSEITAVSGRTMYPGRTMMERVLCLLSRSYLDPGRRDLTRFISGNAAGFRRENYQAHPLPEGLGAFASRIQSEAMIRDGDVFFFEPGMTVVHDFEGWRMECDIRRNHGYCTIITRLMDERLPYAGLIRVGIPAIPLVTIGKTMASFRNCFRCWSHYGLHWYELPVALLFIFITHILEIPGMLAAYRHSPISETAYR